VRRAERCACSSRRQLANGGLGRAGRVGDRRVVLLGDHARVDRVALLRRQRLQRDGRVVAGLDRAQIAVGELQALHAEPPPRALLDAAAPGTAAELVAGDPACHPTASPRAGSKRKPASGRA
jgi:hypothetical protein